jgi:hypothetical protein
VHICIVYSLNALGCNKVRVRGGIVIIFNFEAHAATTHTHVLRSHMHIAVHGRAVNILEANMADSVTQWTAKVDGINAINKNLTTVAGAASKEPDLRRLRKITSRLIRS